MNDSQLPKSYLRWAPRPAKPNLLQIAIYVARGLLLAPIYWLLGYLVGTPGLHFRRRCIWVGMKVLLAPQGKSRIRRFYELLVHPLDSFRYFEFDFAWKHLSPMVQGRYLDVSSPRLLPLLFVARRPRVEPFLLNPDRKDLPMTEQMARELGIAGRCVFVDKIMDETTFADGSFDVITSLSVVEHIPNDTNAILKMWNLLKPGGRLVLTVPCAHTASTEYVDRDEYQLLGAGADGFVFWQRYYDEQLLQSRIFSVTGRPQEMVIYAEKVAGSYHANIREKMSGKPYPTWREPYMMGRKYQVSESIATLPGMGVVGLVFVKPAAGTGTP